MHVTIDSRVDGQQFINNFYYKYSTPETGVTGGRSDTFLTNFRNAFRQRMIPLLCNRFSVSKYWVRSIVGDILVDAGPPAKFRAKYDPDRLDFLEGAAGDVGAIVPDAGGLLPMHCAYRVIKNPGQKFVGYHSRCYNRFGPVLASDMELGASNHDLFDDVRKGVWDAAVTLFCDDAIFDQVGGNGWDMCSFSIQYFGRVAKPAGASITKAAVAISNAKLQPYVGSQVTRRYHPIGGFEGR